MADRDQPRTGLGAPRRRWLVGAAALALLVAYHAWWLLRMRDGYPVDIDEAGYLTIALNDLAALREGGLGGAWDAVQQQVPHAPLVPLLAVPALALHDAVLPAFSVELGALVVVVLASHAIARRLAGPRWALLAALAVAATPGVVNYAREISFALPCAAAVAVSAWALLRSDHLARMPWALLWGVAGGLAVLARTMAIGFLPGLLAAALLVAATAPAPLRRRAFAGLAAGVAAGCLTAATWYWRNLDPVLDYLRGFGYGDSAAAYGTADPVLSLDWWTEELRLAAQQELFLPLLLVLTLVLLAAVPTAVRGLRAPDRFARLRRAAASPAAPLVVLVVEGYLALSSTDNDGSAFALPLLPIAIVLIVAAAARLPTTGLRRAAAGGLAAVAVLQLVWFAQLPGPTGRIWRPELPLLGPVPVVDPRAPVVRAIGVEPDELRFGPRDRGWIELAGDVAFRARQRAAGADRLAVVAFATRDPRLNTNTLALAERLSGRTPPPLAQLTASGGDTVAAYRAFLSDPLYGQPNVLLTSDAERDDFAPVVTQARAEAAARALGFRPFASVHQPDGETVTLWWLERGPAIPAQPVGTSS